MTRRDKRLWKLIADELGMDEWRVIDVVLERMRQAEAGGSRLSPLEASHRESLVEEWLEDHAVARAWDSAPGLVHARITPDDLDQLAARMPATALPAVISWLNDTVAIRESIEIIARSGHRISELVQAVKGYSHMDRAREQYVDIHDRLENTLIILAHRPRNVTVDRDYAKNLPPVRAFGNTLNQVWTNVLANAIDATGGKGNVIIRTARDGDLVVVGIEDNGSGISEADLSCIFEPFYTTKPQGQGRASAWTPRGAS